MHINYNVYDQIDSAKSVFAYQQIYFIFKCGCLYAHNNNETLVYELVNKV